MVKMTENIEAQTRNILIMKDAFAKEPVNRLLNIRLKDLSPGYACVEMGMSASYLNFNNVIFGGIIMALADQAFAYATNSFGIPNVASQLNIHFISPVGISDRLSAECRVLKRGRKASVSEIEVTNQDNKLVAISTGTTIPLSVT